VQRYCINQQYQVFFWEETDSFVPESCPENMEEAVEYAIRHNKTLLRNSGQNGTHPYHQHINPFQISSFRQGKWNSGADVARECEWRDTIPGSENIIIVFTPRVYTGDVVVHCHLIQHEDHGMMGLYHITDDPQYCKGILPTAPPDDVPTILPTVPTNDVPTGNLSETYHKTCTDPKPWLWVLVGFAVAAGAFVIYAVIRYLCTNRKHTLFMGETANFELGDKPRVQTLELIKN